MMKTFGSLLITACVCAAPFGCVTQEPVDTTASDTIPSGPVATAADFQRLGFTLDRDRHPGEPDGGKASPDDDGCFTSGIAWQCCMILPTAGWYCTSTTDCWMICNSSWSNCSGGCPDDDKQQSY